MDRQTDALDFEGIHWLTADLVREIHDEALEPENLTGEDGARPIESSLGRVEQRVHYGDLELDPLRIGIAYALTIAKAHSFIDGNKRTAFLSMVFFLRKHGYRLVDTDPDEMADLMEAVAGDQVDEDAMYEHLLPHVSAV